MRGQGCWSLGAMNNVMSSGRGWGEGQVGVEANSRQTLPRDSSPQPASEIPSGSYTANCSLEQRRETLPLLSLSPGACRWEH